jgi:hypothetical protein
MDQNSTTKIKKILSDLTGKKNVFIVRRGNIAIRDSLKIAKSKGYKKIFIQDQGGWMTYAPFSEKLKFNLYYIKTDYGLIKQDFFDSILLINTMPGYSHYQNPEDIKTEKCIIINDISGSIGTELSKYGDIIFGSFGNDKPIDFGKKGFIATDYDVSIEESDLTGEEAEILIDKFKNLDKRLNYLRSINKKIKEKLKKFNIIHPNLEGINVLIKTSNESEKQEIMDFCEKNKYEYTICPRYIRMNQEGISIEVKRKV